MTRAALLPSAAAPAESAPSPAAGAIPWLLLRTHESSGGFAGATHVRRFDSAGGTAPCAPSDAARVGETARMRYSAFYEFLGG